MLSALILAAGYAAAGTPRPAPSIRTVAPASDQTIRAVVAAVGAHQLRTLTDGDYRAVASAADLQQRRVPEGLAWNYPWGVTLFGLLRAGAALRDPALSDFPVRHAAVAARYWAFLEGAEARLGQVTVAADHTPLDPLMALGSLDSCGAMGMATLDAVLRHRSAETPEEHRLLLRIADWIVNRQDRLPDGTLWRAASNARAAPMHPGTVWLDDLYMACPFLVRWSEYTGDHRYRDDAARQIIAMAKLLQDRDGVWYHGYFVNDRQRSPIKWGRADGWGMVALVEVLSALPENDAARPELLRILRRQIEGIERLQAPSGLWHQVLDHPEVWEETSCSAMFAYGIARAAHRGWIGPEHLQVARRAFAGIATRVTPEGAVNGTCEGTNIGLTIDFYVRRQRPPDDLHGRGPVLLAGAELLAPPAS